MKVDNSEIWKTIPGFEDYLASNIGRIKSISKRKGSRANKNGGVIKCMIQKMTNGYCRARVTLRKDKKSHHKIVSSLIISAFKGPRPDGAVIRHLDGNPLNNNINNLEYGSTRDNIADSIKHGTKTKPPINYGDNHHKVTISDEDVRYIRALNIKRGDRTKLAKKYNVSKTTIGKILSNQTRQAASL